MRKANQKRVSVGDGLDHPSSAIWSLAGLWAISGFSILTLETVWMRQMALLVGNTAVAATLVTVVFFFSAALGNFFGATLVTSRLRPLKLYSRYEIAASVAALLTFILTKTLWSLGGSSLTGWLKVVSVTTLLVGLPSFLSGVAFPSLAETFVPTAERRTSSGAIFYSLNLLGAGCGVVCGGIFLPWLIGLKGAFVTGVCAQFCGGLLALRFTRILRARTESKPPIEGGGWKVFGLHFGWTLVIGSGVLSIAAQSLLIIWARQVLGGSIYTLGGVLTSFLTGLGSGAMISAALRKRGISTGTLLVWFTSGSSLFLFLLPILGVSLSSSTTTLTGGSPAELTRQAVGWCIVTILPGALCLGGIFPTVWEQLPTRFRSEGKALGLALGLNKLGCAAGSVAGSFLLMRWTGLIRGTEAIAWLYAIAAGVALLSLKQRRPLVWTGFALIVALGLFRSLRGTEGLGIAPTLRLIASYSGPYGPVSVVEDITTGSRQILLNSKQHLSGTRHALASQRHQSWVPLFFCRKPERIITIGMAAGISATAALDFPIKELFSVELVPEVVQAAREQFSEWNGPLFNDPRSKIVVGDGRSVMGRMEGQFDAIICDLFFPNEEGSALLYSREFFETAKARLRTDGIFCLWLPCYQHTAESAGMIIRTFMDGFPHAILVRSNFDPISPVLGLIGSAQPIPFSRDFISTRLTSVPGESLATRSPFFRSPETAMLLLVCDLFSANPGFAMYPSTTDDYPLFSYLGPRQPRRSERLVGFPLLNWIGKRALQPYYPSCDLAQTSPQELLNSVRAGNLYFAAATANTSLPGDVRPFSIRQDQVRGYVHRALELSPKAQVSLDLLGQ